MREALQVTPPNFCDRALSRVSTACLLVSSGALVVLIATFGWLVFGRYVLNVTPTWVEQLALVLVCWIAFLGAATGVREDAHLGVTFIREAMPRPIRRALRVIVDIIMAGFGVVMAVSCYDLAMFGWDTLLPMLNVPETVRTGPASICGALIFAFSAARAGTRIHRYWIAAPAATKAV
jgi:TRAP-type C4-dicarboxylate transport system permease small subunit